MKSLLGALMCLVVATAQCFAISGGPNYGGSLNVVGTFGGVMEPSFNTSADDCSANSIGVFSVGVPSTGIASGSFVMFAQGRVFSGTIQGTADPGKARLAGILSATFDFTVTEHFFNPVTGEITTTMTDVTADANGKLDAKISGGSSQFSPVAATRLSGTATLDISQGQVNADLSPHVTCEMNLVVTGFKQSSTATTATG
jgi:hypothetical protein